jgi:primosomal protein N' (replication factor Y)
VLISVAVPVPALDELTYAVPDGVAPPSVGARVVVPLGTRSVTGIVVGHAGHAAPGVGPEAVREIGRVLDSTAFVPPDVVALARWTADYYAAGLGATVTAVLPPLGRDARHDAHKARRVGYLTAAGLAALEAAGREPGAAESKATRGRPGQPTRRQIDALRALAGPATGVPLADLARRGVGHQVVTRLVDQGLVRLEKGRVERDPFEAAPFAAPPAEPGRQPTAAQAGALDRLTPLAAAGRFHVALLHGVTGSGKTEVYLRLAAEVRRAGRGVLMLVPEIALTPAVAAAFRQAFGREVAVQHSGLSAGERHDQWHRIRAGEVDVVVGTRSAVFAPLARLGLVIVDEEHDASYKQEESPRYSGRDLAIVRGQQAQALVVLGSATPSLETYHHAMTGRYARVVLDRRVHDRPLAEVTVVDMRSEYAAEGPEVIFSRPLRAAIARRLEQGEQALVLLNRRGYARAVFCRQCAGTIDCPNCSVSLVVHGEGAARRARCHYCNFAARVPGACPACGGGYLEQSGVGTEQVASQLSALFPAARVARVDRDAIRRRGALPTLLTRFRDREIDVLVGTQMIAKGHDFPAVTLVGVISADVGLGMADFRAAERTFQLLTQVAGRAGRGDRRGEAIVQTLYPDHYSIQLACGQDYPAFYDRELRFRRSMGYPPTVSLVNVIVRARTLAAALSDAAGIVARLRECDQDGRSFVVLGPAQAPLVRLRGEFRVQCLVKGRDRRRMREALLSAVHERPDVARRTTIDVDPLSVL